MDDTEYDPGHSTTDKEEEESPGPATFQSKTSPDLHMRLSTECCQNDPGANKVLHIPV